MVLGHTETDRNEWLHTRKIAYYIVKGWATKETAPPTEAAFMPLTKDEIPKPVKFTKRQKEKIKEKLDNAKWKVQNLSSKSKQRSTTSVRV